MVSLAGLFTLAKILLISLTTTAELLFTVWWACTWCAAAIVQAAVETLPTCKSTRQSMSNVFGPSCLLHDACDFLMITALANLVQGYSHALLSSNRVQTIGAHSD
eukprot:3707813-Amphidinium_carterae.1